MDIIELDIGGIIFRTTKDTLCKVDGFFKRMLESGNWKDGRDKTTPIFVDRDPTTFHCILSYLRSGRIFFTGEDDANFLEMLLLEADYYQLEHLIDVIKEELERRENHPEEVIYKEDIEKVIKAREINSYLSRGWKYIGSYEGNESFGCSNNSGSKEEAEWRNESCSVCGESLIYYDKFLKHTSFFKPTMIVISKK